MKEIDDLAYNGINRYFHALSTFGYMPYGNTCKLLLVLFILRLFSSSMAYYVSEDDYRDITRLLYKIYGTNCLVSYPEYLRSLDLNEIIPDPLFRISENSFIRTTKETIRNSQ